ncbi:MAG TPA: cation diffusion facilitator family transporter [Acidobacteriota bacterium]|nr:cation diffusion facilitator family transporter [Acidobacteriota bacterium]HNT17280.1 cation diffusion facilitator family transporter [Acidobacteriota bacterium]HPA26343.1 cation diffusion facilitator family transporter [Acidobacteriota bacterium]
MNHQHGAEKGLYFTVILNGLISVVEFAAGVMTNSLALISDSAHNISDFFAVLIALIARIAGRKPPTLRHTYGFRRLEVIAALVNALTLVALMAILLKESVARLISPVEPPGQAVIVIVAFFALLANSFSVMLLRKHGKEDLNTKSAFLHMLQDALASLVVMISALFYKTSFGRFVDPVATILISLFVLRSAISILWETFMTLLEGVPADIDIKDLVEGVEKEFGDVSIHHIHIWQNGPGDRLLTAHLHFREKAGIAEIESRIAGVRDHLEKRWDISHITLEPESEGCGENGILPGGKGSSVGRAHRSP